jgi:hypothetical protein
VPRHGHHKKSKGKKKRTGTHAKRARGALKCDQKKKRLVAQIGKKQKKNQTSNQRNHHRKKITFSKYG